MDQAGTAALEYLAANLSVIPILNDGSKSPPIAWDQFKERRPTVQEVTNWFTNRSWGVAIIGGAVSGNLGVIDIEFPDIAVTWCELVEMEAPGLVSQLPQVVTPGKGGQPGKHFYFRGEHSLRSMKLAKLTEKEAEQRTGDPKKQTAIEIKAEGGYVLSPGCPANCHPSGRLYRHVGGPFIEEVPQLPDDQVSILLSCARVLDRSPQPKGEPYRGAAPSSINGQARPGDVYNMRADWRDILVPHGWVFVRQKGSISYWRRPGKDKGLSATTGYCHSDKAGDLLCVFSTNADPLTIQDGHGHQCFSKFGAYAILNHKGDFPIAARTLATLGFGFDQLVSAAEHAAKSIAMGIRDMDAEGVWEDVLDQMRRRNEEKSWDLTSGELQEIVDNAKQKKIESDPKLLSEQVRNSIAASENTPDEPGKKAPWKLTIIDSDPPTYLLRSPFWSSRVEGGAIRLKGAEILTWSKLRLAALDQSGTSPPEKIHAWSQLLQRLLDHADHLQTELEAKRSLVVAEFIWSMLLRAPVAKKDEAGAIQFNPMGGPIKLPDGRIAIKSDYLQMIAAMKSQEKLTRQEFTDCMKKFGMTQKSLGSTHSERTRWWVINPTDLVNLGKEVLADASADEVFSPHGDSEDVQ